MTEEELYLIGISVLNEVSKLNSKTQKEIEILSVKLYNKMPEISTTELYKQGRYIEWKNATDKI